MRDFESEGLLEETKENQTISHPAHKSSTSRSTFLWKTVATGTLIVATTVIFWALVNVSDLLGARTCPATTSASKDQTEPAFVILGDCGDSFDEAQQQGCIFDILLGHWVSPPCFDRELHNSYLEKYQLQWYWDPSFNKPASRADVAKGQYKGFWISNEYHYYHCAYLLDILVKAYTNNTALPGYIWSYGHTKHCTTMLVERDWGRNETYLETGYTKCILPTLSKSRG